MKRIPEGDCWEDHAEPCPNCGKPVMKWDEHLVPATMTDPFWWTCDKAEEKENER